LAVAILLAIPLLYTQGLPRLALLRPLVAPTPPPAPPAPMQSVRDAIATQSNLNSDHGIVMPHQIPTSIANLHEDAAPPPISVGVEGIQGGIGDRWTGNSVIGSIFSQQATAMAVPPGLVPAPRPIRPSSVMEANL